MSANDIFSKTIVRMFLLWAFVAGGLSDQCQVEEVEVSVSTRRNNSGHWTLDVFVAQDNERNPPRLNFHPKTIKCGTTTKTTLHITLQGSPPRPPAGLGYEFIPEMGYYKMHTTPAKWQEAKAGCEKEGTHLLILNSDAEAAAIGRFINQSPSHELLFAIGFNDLEQDRHYVTIFGESLESTGYVRWAKGQPSNEYESEACGLLHRSLELHDYRCHHEKPFICEQEI